MKYSIAVLFTLIVCFSTNILAAPKFKSHAEEVIKEKLNLTSVQFITKCLSKGRFEILKLFYDRIVDDKIPNRLANDMLDRAKKIDNVAENDWKQITNDVCLTNASLRFENESDVGKINLCFDEKSRLEGKKKADFTNALLGSFCSSVEILAKEKFAEMSVRKDNP
ncbi:uncharacterized protein LOC117173174 [Belonocnema kinseyi]|uniref:uncharacterized protein LOC117173174 n=1 Tax=Belonocnema kinseyi TaxID=2817044 RepID=UPI00143CD25E|nr:uncharacterized protein LOC117173174 [Belonocnema kinseyi]